MNARRARPAASRQRPSLDARRRRARRSLLPALLTWGLVALLVHVVGVAALPGPHGTGATGSTGRPPIRLTVVPPPEREPEPEPEPELPSGQLVDLPEPKEKERPEDADYLAEFDRTVPEETRTDRFKVNPEVLAPEYSTEERLELEEAVDLGMNEPSTGAQQGNDRFDPERHGNLAALPSPWQLTNRDGLQKPVPVSHASQSVAGAPNNDLLDETEGRAVNLNTSEFLYATYLNQIRRLVNFYWNQNLDNIPASVRLVRSRYSTVVEVTLTEDGLLDAVVILQESHSDPLDQAVVGAFRTASPFPPPPAGLVGPDGLAHLGTMEFVVQVGHAQAAYMGIDPRAGVQFPGILKAPR